MFPLYRRLMATGTNILEALEENVSPLPRAPPPSPECPTHKDDITQFDFNALFISGSLKTSPLSSREPSEPTSPSWNESGNFNQSPFFYPSPDRPQATPTCTTNEEHPTAISVPASQQLDQGVSYSCTEPAYASGRPHPSHLSTSLPINGDMDQLHAYYTQHNRTLTNMERIAETGGEMTGQPPTTSSRRRKISLKRQHSDDYTHFPSSPTSETMESEAISKKKACPEEMQRERESRNYDVQSLSNSVTSKLSLQSAYQQQQVGSYPVISSSHYLTNNPTSSPGATGVLPRHADSYPLASNGYFMAEGGHPPPRGSEYVQPQGHVQQTIGFNMSSDDQMDTTDHTHIPISITRVDSQDTTSMDINHTVMNNSFSFDLSSLGSSSFLSPSRPRT